MSRPEGEAATDVAAVQAMAALYPSEVPDAMDLALRTGSARPSAHVLDAWLAVEVAS